MIRKITFVLISATALPLLALAAGNDVTLTTSAIIRAGGSDFDVSGSSGTIQSITVNASNFTVTLASGSSITISQPGLFEITNDVASDVTGSVCSSATSSLTLAYSGAGTVTNTISASSTSCSTATPGAPTSVSAAAGNAQATVSFTAPSQGGSPITNYMVTSNPGSVTASGSASPITVTGLANGTAYTFTVVATNSSGNGPASAASNSVTPSAPVVSSGGSGGGGGSSSSGGSIPPTALVSLLAPSASTTAYLNSIGTSTVPGCPTGYTCAPAPGSATTTPVANASMSYSFSRDLTLGSTGADVKALQVWLNAHGYAVASAGGGSPGHETSYLGPATQAALVKFQKASGIYPAVGYFGPLTRAAIDKLGGATENQPPSVQPAANAPSINVFNRDLTLGSTGADVRSLQVWLNAHGYLVAAAGKPGSPGNETDLFGSATQAAIMSLQRDNDIKPAAGYFGPLTRAYVNNH